MSPANICPVFSLRFPSIRLQGRFSSMNFHLTEILTFDIIFLNSEFTVSWFSPSWNISRYMRQPLATVAKLVVLLSVLLSGSATSLPSLTPRGRRAIPITVLSLNERQLPNSLLFKNTSDAKRLVHVYNFAEENFDVNETLHAVTIGVPNCKKSSKAATQTCEAHATLQLINLTCSGNSNNHQKEVAASKPSIGALILFK